MEFIAIACNYPDGNWLMICTLPQYAVSHPDGFAFFRAYESAVMKVDIVLPIFPVKGEVNASNS